MKTISSIAEMQQTADDLRRGGKRIGCVPTMGFLHEGHCSLMRIARQHADAVITSLFVNPTQFGPHEDFGKYPRDLQRDGQLAEQAGTDILFIPSTGDVYPSDYRTYVDVEELTDVLEGKFRPTHFRGVTTIVTKLFHIIKPHVAVFGQKDAQQAVVIKQVARDLSFDIEIIVGPIVRETDGLAMSSRNVYLTPTERQESVALSQSLKLAEKRIRDGQRNSSVIISEMIQLIRSKPSATIDYVSIVDATTLQELSELSIGVNVLVSLAVRIGGTRLIDNIIVTV